MEENVEKQTSGGIATFKAMPEVEKYQKNTIEYLHLRMREIQRNSSTESQTTSRLQRQ